MSRRSFTKSPRPIRSNGIERNPKGPDMRRTIIFAILTSVGTAPVIAQQQPAQAQVHVDPATARFDAVLKQSLGALQRAQGYAVDVDSKWNSTADVQGPQTGSHYRLVSLGGRYRVEIQSLASQSPDLICVNDGAHVTTYYPARKFYSQHAAESVQAALDENKM